MYVSQSPFAGVPVATLQAWLASAQEALFKLTLPNGIVAEVGTGGDFVKYNNKPNVADLEARIAQLQAAIAGRPQGGAIGAIFAL